MKPSGNSHLKRNFLIAFVVIIIIICLGVLYLFLPYLEKDLPAVLKIGSGTVEINKDSSWSSAQTGMELKQGFGLRTGQDSEAIIILNGNSQIRLDENTEILIKELYGDDNLTLRIHVIEGDVWSDISSVGGIGSYILETPDGNITDIGTSFGTSVRLTVPVKTVKSKTIKPIGTTIAVTKGYVQQTISTGYTATIAANTQSTCSGGTVTIDPITEDSFIQKNKVKSDNIIVEKRESIKKKYSNLISTAKSLAKDQKYNLDDATIDSKIDSYLKGEIDVKGMVASGAIPKQYVVFIPKEFFVTPKNAERVIYTKDITKKDIFIPLPKDVVVDKKTCSFGQLKEEIVETGRTTATLRGAESIKIKDWKGYRGLPASEQREVIENMEKGILILHAAELGENAIDIAFSGHSIVKELAQKIPDLLYAGGTIGATESIMHKLKEWQELGALGGLPEWIDIEVGPIWTKYITKIKNEKRIYVCQNDQWIYRNKEKAPDTYKKSECFENTLSPIDYKYKTNIENVDLQGCTAGSCPNAWRSAFSDAIAEAMSKYHLDMIGECPED